MKDVKVLVVSILFLFVGLKAFSQTENDLYNRLKGEYEKLQRLETQSVLSKENTDELFHVKMNIRNIKTEMKKLNRVHQSPIYSVNNVVLDSRFILLDFYMYEYSQHSYSVIARLHNTSDDYCDWVKLRFNFYKDGQLVNTDFTYIDYESYGSTGMLPYHLSFIDTYADIVGFDDVDFEIDYDAEWRSEDDCLWDQILTLESSQIRKPTDFQRWFGSVRNNVNYSVRWPTIFASILEDGNMIGLDWTFLDVSNDSLPPYSTGVFDSFIDLPDDYDEIEYYLGYALWTLEGSGNIPPNTPVFTQTLSYQYNGQVRIVFNVEFYIIDHEDIQKWIQVDWGDLSPTTWEGPFSHWTKHFTLSHSYANEGSYNIRARAKDDSDAESDWSEIRSVTIQPTPELWIIEENLNHGTYQIVYQDTIRAQGGILPYTWAIVGGSLPDNVSLDANTGEIDGIPTASGRYDFLMEVTDGGIPVDQDTAAFTIIIANNVPIFVSEDSVGVLEHQELIYSPQAVDPDGHEVTYDLINSPKWLLQEDSSIRGIPQEGALDTLFAVTATDGDLIDTLEVKVTIIPVNDPPFITSQDTVIAYTDSVFEYTAQAVDPEDSTVVFNFIDYPEWLTFSDSTITGTPTERDNDTSFVVIVSDEELSDSLKVFVDVIVTNYSPQLVNVSDFSFINADAYTISLDTCVTDQDDDVSSMIWDITCPNANLQITMQNQFVIFTAPGWVGTCDVKFKVTDPEGKSDSLTVEVNVNFPAPVIDEETANPTRFTLAQNIPNPFNTSTTIRFTLPRSSRTTLKIYDILGNEVEILVNEKLKMGEYKIHWNAIGVPSGVYVYQLIAGEFVETKKLILQK